MANQPALKSYYTFVKGLATNVSPMNSPENTCSEMMNVQLDQDGSLAVRPSLSLLAGPFTAKAATTGDWCSVAEGTNVVGASSTDKRYLFVYTGDADITALDVTSLSSVTKLDTIAAVNSNEYVSMAFGKGRLVYAGKSATPRKVKISSGVLDQGTLSLKERDFVGLNDSLNINERPSSLSQRHLYNLYNQGWSAEWASLCKVGTGLGDAIGYPSNADIPWMGVYTDVNTGLEFFSPFQIKELGIGTSPAPKGKLIRNVFNTGTIEDIVADMPILSATYNNGTTTLTVNVPGDWTGQLSGGDSVTFVGTTLGFTDGSGAATDTPGTKTITSLSYAGGETTIVFNHTLAGYVSGFLLTVPGKLRSNDFSVMNPDALVETNYCTAVGYYAGRIWYGGIEPAVNEDLRGALYFSQLLESNDNLNKCYQANDPTDRNLNELLATDGGRVVIAEMGVAKQMVVSGSNLIVFATNGVWAVSGGEGGFSPTSYAVRKISDRGVQSGQAAVVADGQVLYYSSGSIYAVTQDEITGFLTSKSVSDHIDDYFSDTITAEGAVRDAGVRAAFDKFNKRVYWLFANTIESGTPRASTHCLVFDMRLGAYYPYTFATYKSGSNYQGIVGLWAPEYGYSSTTGMIFIGVDYNGTNTRIKLFTLSGTGDDAHITSGGNFDGYWTTGHAVLDAAMMKKQMPRVGVYMERAANSSLYMQGRFNWTNSGNSGKWGSKQQCYFERGAEADVCYRTLTVRGVGKSLQLRFECSSAAAARVYGWDAKYTGMAGNDT